MYIRGILTKLCRVGAVLYTSYLQFLGTLHTPSSQSTKRVYPPAPLDATFIAGFAAGTVQSVVAAPLDALQVRFKANEMLEGQYRSMWEYGRHKLHEIGARGVFAGWGLSFLRESLGYGVFFATFEYMKSQSYYYFVTRFYGPIWLRRNPHKLHESPDQNNHRPILRPHYALEPTFLLLAGVVASVTQQIIQYPLGRIQNVHYNRLESQDYQTKHGGSSTTSKKLRMYYHAYQKTLEQCKLQAMKVGGWRTWLYKGYIWNTIKQVPSTSAGLIMFELVRRKYANQQDAARIEKDGYDILLS
jgi:hypothetical protein